jgi:hypothetical protein
MYFLLNPSIGITIPRPKLQLQFPSKPISIADIAIATSATTN